MSRMSEAELMAEVAAALNRGRAASEKQRPAPTRHVCSVCRQPLSCPVYSCTLRRHPYCAGCVRELGGRHRCHVCVPGTAPTQTTTVSTRGLRSDGLPDVMAPDASSLCISGLDDSTVSAASGKSIVAKIESFVDPAVRDLLLEAEIAGV